MERFVIIGLGGIGSQLLEPLVRFLAYSYDGDCALTLVDADRFDRRNIVRQSCIASDIGKPKVDVALARVKDIAPTLRVAAVPHWISESNIASIIREGSQVFCCVDNHRTRKLVNDYCATLTDVVLVSGGNEYSDGNAQLFVKEAGVRVTAALDEWHPEIAEPTDVHPADAEVEREGCDMQTSSAPQLVFANNMASAMMMGLFFHNLEARTSDVKRIGEIYFDLKLGAVAAYERPSFATA